MTKDEFVVQLMRELNAWENREREPAAWWLSLGEFSELQFHRAYEEQYKPKPCYCCGFELTSETGHIDEDGDFTCRDKEACNLRCRKKLEYLVVEGLYVLSDDEGKETKP